MSGYAIAELGADQTGGFAPRGALKRLWQSRDFETIVAGPAETGKTWGSLQYVDALLWKFPRAQGVMIRKTYAALISSVLRTYLRILGPDSPVKAYGGEKPQWFDYPNGSRLWIAGFDNAGKALSSERDFAYVNQAEELSLSDWETLTTRCTGRGAVMPYTRVFGDCNPGPPTHWIKARERSGALRLLESRHADNPTLFTDDGTLTPQGARSLAVLDALTGVRKERLRHGRWVQAEGAVYEQWDRGVHLIDRFPVPWNWPRYWSIDFGYTNPFVWQLWAEDPDGRLFLVRQIYRTQRLVEDHARRILEVAQAECLSHWKPRAILCDHDAEDRATLEKHLGRSTSLARKEISFGIQAVSARLKPAGDGRPRLYVLRDSLDERDARLEEARRPTCTEDEFENYVWQPPSATRPETKNQPDVPVDCDNHGMDALRYMVAHFERGRWSLPDAARLVDDPKQPQPNPRTSHAATRGLYGRGHEEDDE